MIIFNTTYHVENLIADDFIKFLREEYIPAAVAGKGLSNPRLSRVLVQQDAEGEGLNFALQFDVADFDQLDEWYEECGDELNENMVASFGGQIVGFSTLMEALAL